MYTCNTICLNIYLLHVSELADTFSTVQLDNYNCKSALCMPRLRIQDSSRLTHLPDLSRFRCHAAAEEQRSGPELRFFWALFANWSALPRCFDRRMRELKRLPDRTPVPAGAMPRQPRWPTAAARRRAQRLRRRAAGTAGGECKWSGCQRRSATGDVGAARSPRCLLRARAPLSHPQTCETIKPAASPDHGSASFPLLYVRVFVSCEGTCRTREDVVRHDAEACSR
jgi:hypothetical protein